MPTVTLRYAKRNLNEKDLANVLRIDGGMSAAKAAYVVDRVSKEKETAVRFGTNEATQRFADEIKRLGIICTVSGKLDPGKLHDTQTPGKLREYANLIPPGETDVVCYGGPFDRTGHYVPEEWDSFSINLHGWSYEYVQGVRQDCLEDKMRVFQYVGRKRSKTTKSQRQTPMPKLSLRK